MKKKNIQITVIGGGLAGSITVTELLKQFPVAANITLVEQDPGRVGGGIAYGATTAEGFHQTNAPARRMIEAVTGNAEEMVPVLGLEAHKVIPRHKVREVMLSEMYNAAAQSPAHSRLDTLQGEVTDITEDRHGKKVHISFDSGNRLNTDILVLATGNIDQRELPAMKAAANDDTIMEYCINNQWLPDGKRKMDAIPLDGDVLIVGTALGGYDAARSLLKRGHKGKIVLMSRHGLEHPVLPENIPMPPTFTLPRPRFMDLLDDPAEAVKEMVAEYRELTGLTVDLEKDSVDTSNWRTTANLNPDGKYLPHHVLLVWEKHMPEIIEKIGMGKMNRLLKEHAALVMTLTTGASNNICGEIEAAKASGQLSVTPAEISAFKRSTKGVKVQFCEASSKKHMTRKFAAVISSLGTNLDFSQTKSPLWQNILAKGYTSPHPIGVGVCIDSKKGFGALPGSDIIYAVGIPAAGERMSTEGSLGSSACSAVAMREGAVRTVASIIANFTKNSAKKTARRKNAKPSGPASQK